MPTPVITLKSLVHGTTALWSEESLSNIMVIVSYIRGGVIMSFRVGLFLLALAAAPQAQAAYYLVAGNAGSGTTQVPGPSPDYLVQGAAPVADGTQSKTVTPSDYGSGWSVTNATASAGTLKTYAWAQAISTAPGCCSGGGASGSARAAFQDNFVVRSSQFADGTTATLTARILIDGRFPMETSGGFWSSIQSWSWNFGLSGIAWTDSFSQYGDAVNGVWTVGNGFGYRTYTANIILGQATTTRMDMTASIFANAGGFGGSFVEVATDLGHTVTWRGITSLTVGGVEVTDFTAFSDTSGFDFRRGIVDPVNGVPEPASWAMLIVGFGLTGATMRRRRVAGAIAP
jgi:hypothetical protein